ncbi:hypothetical protein FHX08_000253 [Rhizobium sp. BK529]|uniref:hypothetical protein n=1 Tax=unclassified Rhizobium TaxID=2613769 RepID=UPI00105251F5|nr:MULTISPECIES: hypothetical protein [unclassified Rhizobium]MBB3589909.1 hypothetical protein [Rhizobium sp. BK529]TCS04576.1 hypothetical protein EV281_103251 [Rhizobium sp. BK418]
MGLRLWTISLTAALAANSAVFAADMARTVTPEAKQIETESGWTFTFAPYFWGAGLSGDVAQFGLPSVHVDASFGDIWDHLDFGAMATGEARYDRYSVFGDIIYTKISSSEGTPFGVLADEAKLDTEVFTGLVGVGYSVLDDAAGHLDVVGGARVWSVDTKISLEGGLLDGRSRSDGDTWVDAVGGIKGTYALTPNVFLTGWGLVGGGGANLDWDVAATIGYKFNETVSSVIGYRAIGVDYENDGFEFDVVEQGPILGLVIHF